MSDESTLATLSPRFKGKRIALVDDRQDVMDVFIPLLEENGAIAVRLLHPEGEKSAELIDRIVQAKPNILLLDGNLAGEVRGTQMVPTIKARLPETKIIGFSSAESMSVVFMKVEADGFVFKNIDDPSASINELAWIL
jgi:CheY-like chemotaxis protein